MPTQPTAGAMRAANSILAKLEPQFGAWLHRDEMIAEIIDAKTALPELISALEVTQSRLASLGFVVPEINVAIAKAKGQP